MVKGRSTTAGQPLGLPLHIGDFAGDGGLGIVDGDGGVEFLDYQPPIMSFRA